MRKRILIGAIAVIAVGALAFVLSQPKQGSVEYHKRKYLEAFKTGMLARLARHTGWNALDRADLEIRRGRVAFHEQALIDARFFERKEFIFSNLSLEQVTSLVYSNFFTTFGNTYTNAHLDFPIIHGITSSGVTLIAQPHVMRQVEELIRQADVPEPPQ